MFRAIIIGFDYSPDLGGLGGNKKLPGTAIDIYRAHSFFKNISKISDIMILTDISTAPDTESFVQAVFDGFVDSGIIDFFPANMGSDLWKNVQTENQLLEPIVEFLGRFKDRSDKGSKESKDKLDGVIVYYTGHAKDNSFILPNGDSMSLQKLTDIIVDRSLMNGQVETLFILDCCSMKIDFEYKKSIFIVSSDRDSERVMSTVRGSLFTKVIFDSFQETRRLQDLHGLFSMYNQNYQSNIEILIYNNENLWEWVFGDRIRISEYKNFFVFTDLLPT